MTSTPSSSQTTGQATEFRRTHDEPTGMFCLDTSRNERVATVMELVGALSRVTDPKEVLRVFSQGMTRLYGPRGYISLSTRGLKPGEYRITRLIHDMKEAAEHPADPWHEFDQLTVHAGGFLGQLIRSAYPEVICNLQVPDDPVLGDALARYGSLMAIPLFEAGEPLNWAISLSTEPIGFSEKELEESILRGNLIGGTVRNVLITQQLRDANEQIRREVDQIARIQRALLPAKLPRISGLVLAANLKTFDTAGGDIYDFQPLRKLPDGSPDPDGPWAILIADASGHGPAAATVVAMLNAILYAYPDHSDGPGCVLSFANHHLYAKGLDGTFVTAILGIYDPMQQTFRYARAGHNPALVKNPGVGGVVTRLDSVGGLPLGVLEDVVYEEATIQLKPEQSVVLYTDGITEATDLEGREFGIDGIERALTQCSGDPGCVTDSISSALLAHEAGRKPGDDQTMVLFKVTSK